ncbi:hypothetical protein EV363DRAFT_960609 [Boletus edulis]|nr:hypothetical protein EV363DRAFT_960609 [Boletus edulis]
MHNMWRIFRRTHITGVWPLLLFIAHFRVNPALEEAVSAWKAARSDVLRLSREAGPMTNSGQNLGNDKTPRRFRTPVQNGRKRRHAEVSPSSDSDIACVAGPSKPNASSEIADSSPLRAKSARKASRRRASIEPSSDPREEELEPDSLVECPICGRSVKFQVINAHMDGPDCGQKSHSKTNNPSNPNSKVEWSRVFGGESSKGKNKNNSDLDDPMERLPKVSYDVVKDKTLKELLSSQRLPVGGDRNTRIARHRRWVMMYNANLDKGHGL